MLCCWWWRQQWLLRLVEEQVNSRQRNKKTPTIIPKCDHWPHKYAHRLYSESYIISTFFPIIRHDEGLYKVIQEEENPTKLLEHLVRRRHHQQQPISVQLHSSIAISRDKMAMHTGNRYRYDHTAILVVSDSLLNYAYTKYTYTMKPRTPEASPLRLLGKRKVLSFS